MGRDPLESEACSKEGCGLSSGEPDPGVASLPAGTVDAMIHPPAAQMQVQSQESRV